MDVLAVDDEREEERRREAAADGLKLVLQMATVSSK